MMAELMEDKAKKKDSKEKKDFEDACLTMEEWKSVLDEDKKERTVIITKKIVERLILK